MMQRSTQPRKRANLVPRVAKRPAAKLPPEFAQQVLNIEAVVTPSTVRLLRRFASLLQRIAGRLASCHAAFGQNNVNQAADCSVESIVFACLGHGPQMGSWVLEHEPAPADMLVLPSAAVA